MYIEVFCQTMHNFINCLTFQAFFEHSLPRVMPNFEARTGQIDMALAVTHAFNHNEIALLEAGTGTGKSLAYLVPSTMWSLKNNAKVSMHILSSRSNRLYESTFQAGVVILLSFCSAKVVQTFAVAPKFCKLLWRQLCPVCGGRSTLKG